MLITYVFGILTTLVILMYGGRPHPPLRLRYVSMIVLMALIWPISWIYGLGYIHGNSDKEKE